MSKLFTNRLNRRHCLFFGDISIVFVTYLVWYILYYLSFQEFLPPIDDYGVLINGASLVIVYGWALYTFGLHDSLWRYAGIEEIIKCAVVSSFCGLIFLVWDTFFYQHVPFFVNISALVTITFMLISYRLLYRTYRRHLQAARKPCPRAKTKVLLVGAGSASMMLLNEMRVNKKNVYDPVAVVDDAKDKIGRRMHNVKIEGTIEDIPRICSQHHVEEIFICIPSATTDERNRVIDIATTTQCKIKIMPEVYCTLKDSLDVEQHIREVQIEDLLGREPINFQSPEVNQLIAGKTVLVTGGGGSIGSELCRQIAKFSPKRLIILDIYENNAYDIQQELRFAYGKQLELNVEIASIRDYKKLEKLFNHYSPQLVFHAAAHKHVPLMEDNPEEALKNNILGTYNVAQLAKEHKVEKFVLISTDKAVNPTNIMGATKRFTELVVQYLSKEEGHTTEFATVRFGNVIGSNGSVIPLFKRQMAQGGPLTVTHKDIVRYFMTISEAVQLVLQAGAMAKGGEIFVLDMGKPVKILEMAEQMVRLAGLTPYKDIDIQITGLRPGEKLYEELLLSEEGLTETANNRIFIGQQMEIDSEAIRNYLLRFKLASEKGSKEDIVELMKEAVPTYYPQKEKQRVTAS